VVRGVSEKIFLPRCIRSWMVLPSDQTWEVRVDEGEAEARAMLGPRAKLQSAITCQACPVVIISSGSRAPVPLPRWGKAGGLPLWD
jgi:hypothetical protein